ncbi:lipid-A-disaccharide synthase [Legionella shakespearei]|uniref:Lipid-A-disaccharide synthase n=1 Tax=Legionella shakespearei DSM 23087 TaxID=1122169 RepID=A0A0W0Z509_9GAMM|nr:lipid-A-disaccharide synthase [Legionella shakespearei]KTD64189.1 lipid-A-disaccharide synthase [Legionella shakespearei DSM 23087]
MTEKRPLKIAIVAGEMSGDLLGSGLIRELKNHYSPIEFTGIGGPLMQQEGFTSSIAMEKLSIMGFTGVLLRVPELLRIRKALIKRWTEEPPDVFIGIDYSDFNLSLELALKQLGIKTVHMVSPKVWAWRQKRVVKIKKAVDLMLTLFPFEASFYQKNQVPVEFIGHPLADSIDLQEGEISPRHHFGFSDKDKIIAVLPGSRMCEMKYMAPLFIEAMKEISIQESAVQFIVPMPTARLRLFFQKQLRAKNYNLNVQILDGKSKEAMAIADVVLVKSGTATLEAMLLKRPMVVAFKCDALSYAIAALCVKVRFISLPNLLADQGIVAEYIQKKATAKPIAKSVINLLDTRVSQQMKTQFSLIHQTLRQGASKKAALAILGLLDSSHG